MSETIQGLLNLPTPFNMVVVIVLICTMGGVVTSVAFQIRKYVCHRQEIAFKQELVDRGLSAGDIERIVAAQSPVDGDRHVDDPDVAASS